MKKISLLAAMAVVLFFFANETQAQSRPRVNGYSDAVPDQSFAGYYAAHYYYFPEIDTYYDIPNRRFVYFEYGRWVFSRTLSHMYSNYDVLHGYKVMINKPRPYIHAVAYRNLYIDYYNAYHARMQKPGVITAANSYPPERRNIPHQNDQQPPRTQERSGTQSQLSSETDKPQKRFAAPREPLQNDHLNKAVHTENPIHSEPAKPEESTKEEYEKIPEHKRLEPAKTLERERSQDHSTIETRKIEIQPKAENRLPLEPIKTERAKTDTVFPAIKSSGKPREAQYSDKFKKPVTDQ